MRKGFTLIQISILLTMASIVMVAILPSAKTNSTANNLSIQRMNTVLAALRQYQTANGLLPCPGDGRLSIDNVNYGVAAANSGTTSNCSGGTPAAEYSDGTSYIAAGMVPVRTLGLSPEYALDGYGRYIKYVVDTNATSCYVNALAGTIAVTDNGNLINTVALLQSAGANGHGARIPFSGSGSAPSRFNASSTDTDELTNAHVDSSFNPTTPLTSYVLKNTTSTFDDLIVYQNSAWSLNQTPANGYNLTSYITSVTTPANPIYHFGQTLNFPFTFSTAVTVGGTPRISMWWQGTTQFYSNYASGSGGTILNFNVQIPAGFWGSMYHYASSTTGMDSPIDLNGGSITSVSTKCPSAFLNYNPPLSNFYVAAPSGIAVEASGHCSGGLNCILVSEAGGGRVDKWNSSAAPTTPTNYNNFGSWGTGNSNLANSAFLATDTTGNIFVADTNNNRIVKWTNASTSVYSAKFGTSGTALGKFTTPTGIVADNTNICAGSTACLYISDPGNNSRPLQRCSQNMLGGTTNCSALPSTIMNSVAINMLSGLVLDGTSTGCTTANQPCLYMVDTGNNRILKINANTGAYIASFGTYGTAGTRGAFNVPYGIALDNTTNCGGAACLWITDSGNDQIQRCPVNMSGGTNCTIYGSTGTGTAPNFIDPTGIAYDAGTSSVMVVDTDNYRVVKLNTSGAYVTSFGSYGTGAGNFNFGNYFR